MNLSFSSRLLIAASLTTVAVSYLAIRASKKEREQRRIRAAKQRKAREKEAKTGS